MTYSQSVGGYYAGGGLWFMPTRGPLAGHWSVTAAFLDEHGAPAHNRDPHGDWPVPSCNSEQEAHEVAAQLARDWWKNNP